MSGPLRIFPAYGLDNSLLTAVLVGLYLRFCFTEWLGWVFSGLVVPGYLAAIILLRPASAIMIIAEAVVTLAMVRGLSSLMSLTKLGTPMFGRDRFVWLVVVSVGVRVVFEALLAPWLETQLRAQYGWDPEDSFGLYGIGLVLVPLLANACWKPGLWRGSFQQVVCIGATYFVLRILLATTNFSFASVAVSFEQLALQHTASPKAYLLLLTGVLLASRANLRFGWDTSGVLIPGLLGLSFFVPSKVLATVAESLLIALAASAFVRLPKVRDWNLEGPRRVVLLFTIGYAIKSCLIAAFGAALPSFTATEIFGIGYLLPSLLALKIWQRKNPAMILLPALSLSIAGFVLGSLFGYELVVGSAALQARLGGIGRDAGSCGSQTTLLSEVRLAHARLARKLPSSTAPRIAGPELTSFHEMLRRLRIGTAQGVTSCAQLVAQVRPSALGLRLQAATTPTGRRFFTLRESAEDAEHLRGFGLIAVAAEPHGGPALIVERPAEDVTDMGALLNLAELLSADAIVVGGLPEPALGRGDVRRDSNVPLRVAVKALAGSAITVRTGPFTHPELIGRVPAAVVESLTIRLGPVAQKNAQESHAELFLPFASEQALAAALVPEIAQFDSAASFVAALLALPQVAPAPPRSSATDLLLAEEVIRPLARVQPPGELMALGRQVAGAASELGLTVALVPGARPRIALFGYGEGLLLTPASPGGALIEVVSRRRGVAELATAIFDAQDAHALLIAVSIPGAADSGPLGRVAAPILALTPPLPPVIVVRAGLSETPDCSTVTDATPAAPMPSPLAQRLTATLQDFGVRSELRAQYDADTLDPPSHLVSLLRLRTQGGFVTLRVGPELRERFRPEPLSSAQRLLFARLGVVAQRVRLEALLAAACTTPRPGVIPEDLIQDARSFATTLHPALIEKLLERVKALHLRLRVIDDERLAEAYLLIEGPGGAAAITLRPQKTAALTLVCNPNLAAQIRQAQSAGAESIKVRVP